MDKLIVSNIWIILSLFLLGFYEIAIVYFNEYKKYHRPKTIKFNVEETKDVIKLMITILGFTLPLGINIMITLDIGYTTLMSVTLFFILALFFLYTSIGRERKITFGSKIEWIAFFLTMMFFGGIFVYPFLNLLSLSIEQNLYNFFGFSLIFHMISGIIFVAVLFGVKFGETKK